MARLARAFFGRYTPTVARELLGCTLVRVVDGKRVSGRIVETEAYRGFHDPASHAYRGRTKRNEVMFWGPGHAYVYFIMGRHFCLNLVTEIEGKPGAVLIRAVEPLDGVEVMKRHRGKNGRESLASGPGNLTQAMAIRRELNGEDVVVSRHLFVEEGRAPREIGVSTRVGISRAKSRKWRYFIRANEFVSNGRPS